MEKIICWKCKEVCKKKELDFEGFAVEGFICPKCGEVGYNPDEIQPILKLNKMVKLGELKATLSELGNSIIIRLPKVIEKIYHLNKGEQVSIKPAGKDQILLKVA